MKSKTGPGSVDDLAVRARFVHGLSKLGNVGAAAALTRLPVEAFYVRRRTDKAFAAEWDTAILVARDTFEEALRRRVLEGIEHKVYRAGQEMSTTRRYSDRLGVYVHQVLDRRAQKIEAKREAEEEQAQAAMSEFETMDPLKMLQQSLYMLRHALEKVREDGHAGTRNAAERMLGDLPALFTRQLR